MAEPTDKERALSLSGGTSDAYSLQNRHTLVESILEVGKRSDRPAKEGWIVISYKTAIENHK